MSGRLDGLRPGRPGPGGGRPDGGRSPVRARPAVPARRRGSRRAGDVADLGRALTQVAATVRAGAPPERAWRAALGVRVSDGVPDLDELAARCGDRSAAAAVVAAARLAAELGVAPAELLDRSAAAMADEAVAAAGRDRAMAGPRATARLLLGLPVLGLALGPALGVDPVAVLLDGAVGSASGVLAVLLAVLGNRWTARLVRAAEAAAGPS